MEFTLENPHATVLIEAPEERRATVEASVHLAFASALMTAALLSEPLKPGKARASFEHGDVKCTVTSDWAGMAQGVARQISLLLQAEEGDARAQSMLNAETDTLFAVVFQHFL